LSKVRYKNIKDDFLLVVARFLHEKKEISPSRKFFDVVYSHKKSTLLDTPWNVSWQICAECNLRCRHCFFEGNENLYDKKQDLTTEKIFSVIDELADDLSVVNLTITGGEPFMRKDIFQILKKLKQKNIVLWVQTNATLITEEKAKKLSEILNLKLDRVQVSLDGANDNLHNTIRGNGVFQKTIKGIQNLLKYNIQVTVNCTVLSTNTESLPELYNLCNKLQIKELSLTKFIPMNDSQNYLVPNNNDLFHYLAKIIKLEKVRDRHLLLKLQALKFFDFVSNDTYRKYMDGYLKDNNINPPKFCDNISCHIHNMLYINCDGTVHFCFKAIDKQPLGNLNDSSMLDIWHNRLDNEFFNPRLSKNMMCKKCKYFTFCKAGCMVHAYDKYNDINYPDSFCQYAKEQFCL